MSDVTIRCPNCGTTQATLGECEACHEADVRYFCPNHAPGRWLDGPQCPTCGARFTGRSAATPPPVPPPRRPPARAADDPWSRPEPPRREPPRRESPRREPPRPEPPVRRIPVDLRPPRVEPEPEVVEDPWGGAGGRAPWPGERGWPRAPRPPELPPFPTIRVRVPSIVGCVGRMVALVVVLLVLASLAFFGYCGAFPVAGEPGVRGEADARWGQEAGPPPAPVR